MKDYVSCKIEKLRHCSEEALIVTLPQDELCNAITLFSAFLMDRIVNLTFADKANSDALIISRISPRSRKEELLYQVDENEWSFAVPRSWIDAIFCMMIDAKLYGWSDTLHIDQEFIHCKKEITICFAIDPT